MVASPYRSVEIEQDDATDTCMFASLQIGFELRIARDCTAHTNDQQASQHGAAAFRIQAKGSAQRRILPGNGTSDNLRIGGQPCIQMWVQCESINAAAAFCVTGRGPQPRRLAPSTKPSW